MIATATAGGWLEHQARSGHFTYMGQAGLIEALGVRRCPCCRAAAVYALPLDRYLHADGTDSRACHLAVTRGRTTDEMNGPSGFQFDHAQKDA